MASIEEVRGERIKKLQSLKERGINPYPINVERTHLISEAVGDFDNLVEKKESIWLIGRILAIRRQGKISFLDLNDGTGQIQLVISEDDLNEESKIVLSETDLGDFLNARGTLFLTKRGEKSLQVGNLSMAAKSLRPLPDKWAGLENLEERTRRRYLDLLNQEVRKRFIVRSNLIKAIRNFLNEAGYLEVETPMLQPLPGGATAKPFMTKHEALDMDLYLRIAPELYLKMLLVGGFNKIFELNRNFRNEGIDATHNPEFTMLEFYESYSNAERQMILVEKLVKETLLKTLNKKTLLIKGKEINYFDQSFERITYAKLISDTLQISIKDGLSRQELEEKAREIGQKVAPHETPEKILDNLYKKVSRPKILSPTFITDYPLAMSPFAKRKEDNPNLIDRFQLVFGGLEIVNAFSELNDPLDQRERYKKEDEKSAKGEDEISPSDESYLEAMEYGLPPAGGVGLGVDRLVMLATGTENIREVILFPTLRPKN